MYLSSSERSLFTLYGLVLGYLVLLIVSHYPNFLSPSLYPSYGHAVYLGYIALIIAPFHHTAKYAIYIPIALLLFLEVYHTLYHPTLTTDIQKAYDEGGLTGVLRVHALSQGGRWNQMRVFDLYVCYQMVMHFYTNYTSGWNVAPQPNGSFLSALDRSWTLPRQIITFTLVLVGLSYINSLIGFVVYYVACKLMFSHWRPNEPINPYNPQHANIDARRPHNAPVDGSHLLPNPAPVTLVDALPTPIKEVVRFCLTVISIGCSLFIVVFIFIPTFIISYMTTESRTQQMNGLSGRWHNDAMRYLNEAPVFPFPALRLWTSRLQWQWVRTPSRLRGIGWMGQWFILRLLYISGFVANQDEPLHWYQAQRADMAIILKETRKARQLQIVATPTSPAPWFWPVLPPLAPALPPQNLNAPPSSSSDIDIFPYGLGLGIGSHALVKRFLANAPRKGKNSLGWRVSDYQVAFSRLNPVYTSTEDPVLQKERMVHHAWISNFPHVLPLAKTAYTSNFLIHPTHNTNLRSYTSPHQVSKSELMDFQMWIQLSQFCPRMNQVMPYPDLVYTAMGEVMFYLATDGLLRQDERAAFLNAINNATHFIPSWVNFLLLGGYQERQSYDAYTTILHAFARYAHGSALKAAFAESKRQGLGSDADILRMLSETFFIAGAAAPCKLAFAVIQRLWEFKDDKAMLEVFDQHPEKFIVECARMDKCVPLVNILADEAIANEIQDVLDIHIDVNTPIHLAVLTANRDPTVFPDPDTFDPLRKNLDQVLSWNGALEGGATLPSRICPGRWFAIAVIHYVVSRFAPVLPSEKRQAKAMWEERKAAARGEDLEGGMEVDEKEAKEEGVTVMATAIDRLTPAELTGEMMEGTPSSKKGGGRGKKGSRGMEKSQEEAKSFSPPTPTTPHGATPVAHPHFQDSASTSGTVILSPHSPSPTKSSQIVRSRPRNGRKHDVPGWLSANEQQVILYRDVCHTLQSADESNLYSGLDLFSRLIMSLMGRAVQKLNGSPPRSVDMLAPINLPTQSLELMRVTQGKWVPQWDEDEPAGQDILIQIAALLLGAQWAWPWGDEDRPFFDLPQALQWRQIIFSALPVPNVAYEELESEEAQSRLAFTGIFCHHTQRIDWNVKGIPEQELLRGEAVYVNDQTVLYQFKVRPPYERYGAAAYFNAKRELVGIYWSHGMKLVRKGDPDWSYVKLVWRTSGFTVVTVKDHLMTLHLIESNALVSASREYLSDVHPLRVFLKPFTFRTVSINSQAASTLINDRGLVHRVWAFDYSEFIRVCDYVNTNYRFRSLPNWIHPTMKHPLYNTPAYDTTFPPPSSPPDLTCLPGDAEEWARVFPISVDLPQYWTIVYEYVKDFFKLVYPDPNGTDALNRSDQELQGFIHELCKQLGLAGITSRTQLMEVLCQCICAVTGLHEHVGQISELLYQPTFINTKLRREQPMQSVQTYSQHLVLVVLTGLRMPALLDDWSHLYRQLDRHEKHVEMHHNFKKKLLERSREVDVKNLPGEREWPFQSFNPRFMECSISV